MVARSVNKAELAGIQSLGKVGGESPRGASLFGALGLAAAENTQTSSKPGSNFDFLKGPGG